MVGPRWEVAPLATIGDLQDLLGLSSGSLLCFADPRGFARRDGIGALEHYRDRWVAKLTGGVRLIEEPTMC